MNIDHTRSISKEQIDVIYKSLPRIPSSKKEGRIAKILREYRSFVWLPLVQLIFLMFCRKTPTPVLDSSKFSPKVCERLKKMEEMVQASA